MREIKFRFWSNHLGRFVVPDDSIFVGALKDPDMNPMQFTGLKDRHGVEIYLGDIVAEISRRNADGSIDHRTLRGNAREVAWTSIVSDYEDDPYIGLSLRPSEASKIEVIGNVWENPELLKDNTTEEAPDDEQLLHHT